MERILGPTSSSTGRSFILEKDTDMVERLWISSMEDVINSFTAVVKREVRVK
jgi:hypothetical protein